MKHFIGMPEPEELAHAISQLHTRGAEPIRSQPARRPLSGTREGRKRGMTSFDLSGHEKPDLRDVIGQRNTRPRVKLAVGAGGSAVPRELPARSRVSAGDRCVISAHDRRDMSESTTRYGGHDRPITRAGWSRAVPAESPRGAGSEETRGTPLDDDEITPVTRDQVEETSRLAAEVDSSPAAEPNGARGEGGKARATSARSDSEAPAPRGGARSEALLPLRHGAGQPLKLKSTVLDSDPVMDTFCVCTPYFSCHASIT